jgi:hypothetical protein
MPLYLSFVKETVMICAVSLSPECLNCKKPLKGRLDKKFCSSGCKNEFNNRLQRQERAEINHIDLILKHNRRILKTWLDAFPTRAVSRTELMQAGLRFDYYTHHYTNHRKDQYVFCYDYGYMELQDGRCLIVRKKE